LSSVSAISNTDVWATGSTGDGSSTTSDLALHWNGTAWSQVATDPNIPALPGNNFASVSADGPNDAWAVGSYGTSVLASHSVIEHWDGSAWTRVPITLTGLIQANVVLTSVKAFSFSNVWAVGSTVTGPDTVHEQFQPLVLHWNGSAWFPVTTPTHGATNPYNAVDGSSAANVWAVGDFNNNIAAFGLGDTAFVAPVQLAPQNMQVAVSQLGHTLYESGSVNGAPGDSLGLGIASHTSPAIAMNNSGQSEIAWTGRNGDLWILDPSGHPTDTGQQVVASTSPGVAALPSGGFEVVFVNAANGLLYERAPDGSVQMAANGLGVEPGTSPAIAAGTSGNFEIAFHANGENTLWTVTPDNVGHDTRWPLMDESSPSVATLPEGGYDVAFEESNSEAMIFPPGGGTQDAAPEGTVQDAGVVMSSDSSPGIAAPAVFANAALVPNVLNDNQTEAQNLITAAGLTIGTPVADTRCIAGPGVVLAEGPNPGTRVALGTAVTLTVSTGRDPRGHICQFK
jgi:hypothetical protein